MLFVDTDDFVLKGTVSKPELILYLTESVLQIPTEKHMQFSQKCSVLTMEFFPPPTCLKVDWLV